MNPGNSTHGCHCSSSACASQNHFPHVVHRTVAGKPQTVLLGETAWYRRSLSSPSSDVSFIDTTLGPLFYRNRQFSINFPDRGSPLQMSDNFGEPDIFRCWSPLFRLPRQTGHLQSRGTGALCIQRDGGERHVRELQNILRVSVNDNTKSQRFSIWLISEYSTSQIVHY